MCLNVRSSRNEISLKYSPREILTEFYLDFKNHFKVVFRSYMEARDDSNNTKNMYPSNCGFIFLIPTVNLQGTQKVFCLNTVRVQNSRNIVPIIAPDQVINKVNDWCKNSKIDHYVK